MGKETFIYREKLECIAQEIYEKYDIKIAFCEIFGKRWSWFAGTHECFISHKRMRISEDLGVIVEDKCLGESFLKELKTEMACLVSSL